MISSVVMSVCFCLVLDYRMLNRWRGSSRTGKKIASSVWSNSTRRNSQAGQTLRTRSSRRASGSVESGRTVNNAVRMRVRSCQGETEFFSVSLVRSFLRHVEIFFILSSLFRCNRIYSFMEKINIWVTMGVKMLFTDECKSFYPLLCFHKKFLPNSKPLKVFARHTRTKLCNGAEFEWLYPVLCWP